MLIGAAVGRSETGRVVERVKSLAGFVKVAGFVATVAGFVKVAGSFEDVPAGRRESSSSSSQSSRIAATPRRISSGIMTLP